MTKVIDIRTKPPLVVKPRQSARCLHKRTLSICALARTVECDDCGALLDPVSVLLEQAHGYRQIDWRLTEYQKMEEALAARERRKKAKQTRQKNKG